MVPFWRGVHSVLEAVFGVSIQFDFKTMYLTDIQELHLSKQDQYLIRILLVTSKKAITKKWLTNVIPTINEWIDLIYSVFTMERITFNFRGKSENFTDGLNGLLMSPQEGLILFECFIIFCFDLIWCKEA